MISAGNKKKLGKGVEGKLGPWGGDPACWSHNREQQGQEAEPQPSQGQAILSAQISAGSFCVLTTISPSRRFPVSAEIPTAPFGWVGSQVFLCLRCHPETSGIRVMLLLSGLSCHQRCDDCSLCEQVTTKERRGVRAVFISLCFNEETGAAVSITRGCISHKSTLK